MPRAVPVEDAAIEVAPTPPNPATFTWRILELIRCDLAQFGGDDVRTVLDPFAGPGGIHALREHGYLTWGVEIEPEWARASTFTFRGDSRTLTELGPIRRRMPFDAVVTSPCLAQDHRVLTNDLRWVAVGDLVEGDRLLAFDEHGPGTTHGGRTSRRRWRRAEVTWSESQKAECVRVILANGDEIITTRNHPWLAWRYSYGGRHAEWIQSADLMGFPRLGNTKGHRRGERQPFYVSKQVDPWRERTTRDAGWLAGMFDGEGSLSLSAHGSPKMLLCQVLGPITDQAEALMREFGYEPNRIVRSQVGDRQKVANLYVTGGFPGLLQALGELRPTGLLAKWEGLDISTRTVEAEKVQVVAVEPVGVREIQALTTTTGTYIGEGYLHHNTYGNRMADHHEARDQCSACNGVGRPHPGAPATARSAGGLCDACGGSGLSRRHTYRHQLGRPLHPANSGGMQWGDDYRELHRAVWVRCYDALRDGGLLVLNIKDHVRAGVLQGVPGWHTQTLQSLGFLIQNITPLSTGGMRHGANRDARADAELVITFRKGDPEWS